MKMNKITVYIVNYRYNIISNIPEVADFIYAVYAHFLDDNIFQSEETICIYKCGAKYSIQNNSQVFGVYDTIYEMLIYFDFFLSYFTIKRNKNLTIFHAASLLLNDRQICIFGHANSGKSTVSYLLHKKGCTFLTDEYLIYDLYTNEFYPFPRNIIIKKDNNILLDENVLNDDNPLYLFDQRRYYKCSKISKSKIKMGKCTFFGIEYNSVFQVKKYETADFLKMTLGGCMIRDRLTNTGLKNILDLSNSNNVFHIKYDSLSNKNLEVFFELSR